MLCLKLRNLAKKADAANFVKKAALWHGNLSQDILKSMAFKQISATSAGEFGLKLFRVLQKS